MKILSRNQYLRVIITNLYKTPNFDNDVVGVMLLCNDHVIK